MTDLPMLEAVGNPVATNPDKELRAVAKDRVWPVLDFRKPVAMASKGSTCSKSGCGCCRRWRRGARFGFGTHVTGSATSPDRASRDCASLARNTCRPGTCSISARKRQKCCTLDGEIQVNG